MSDQSVPTNDDCRVSQCAILRAVASSTAIETDRTVEELEQRLEESMGRFADIGLAEGEPD